MVTEEEIAELMQTQEGRRLIEQMLGDDGTGGALSQIGASPDIPGATRGLPPAQIGASPDIPGATRGLPSGISGADAIPGVGSGAIPGVGAGAIPSADAIPGVTAGAIPGADAIPGVGAIPGVNTGVIPGEENKRRMMMQMLMPGLMR